MFKIVFNQVFLVVLFIVFAAQGMAQGAGAVQYSSLYFGPNANPVPQFGDAAIPHTTTIGAGMNYFGGYAGDITMNGSASVEIPFAAGRISLRVWAAFCEYYQIPRMVKQFRNVQNDAASPISKGMTAIGDVYIQTRMSILNQKRYMPDVVLNITLKTASAKAEDFQMRRYFDTPGYYFDMEIGKSIMLNSRFIKEFRMAADIGFLCWETTASTQNDAIMGGIKLIAAGAMFRLENSIDGYSGWMANGDQPIVFTSRIMFSPPPPPRAWFI
jgi:hypothetical protein